MAVAEVHSAPPEFLQLVADPQRWQLLTHLARSDHRVGELAGLVGKAQNLVSYHLGELRSAGLVSSRRSSADGRDTYYRLEHDRVRDLMGSAVASVHPALRLAPSPAAPIEPRRPKPRVLFLCTGNSARSQIAEALAQHRSGQAVVARSAGSHPKALHPNAVRVMAERGIDISRNRTKHLDRFARRHFDQVITLCDKVKEICPEFPGTPLTAHWSIADPAAVVGDEAGYLAFLQARDAIERRVDLLIAELAQASQDSRRTHVRR